MSFSQWAMTTVATQLPIKLVQARIIPINQSTDSKSTKPIAGKLGITESVAARITKADPGMPCAPFDVISETALLHKDLKVKTSHIYSNLSDNSGMWSA